MVYRINDEVVASAARTPGSTLTSNVRNYSSKEYLWLIIYITAKTTSPTLTLDVQCSAYNPNTHTDRWRTFHHDVLTNVLIGTPPKVFASTRMPDWSGWVRVLYKIGGSGNLTFSINLEAK